MTGKIIRLNAKQGWGFITSKEIPFTRIFFHWSGLKPNTLNFTDLKVGMLADFELLNYQDKGYRAIKISIVDKVVKNGTDIQGAV